MAVARQLRGNRKAVVKQSQGSCKAVARQSRGSHEAVTRQSRGSHETNDPATTGNAKIQRLAELKSALHEVHELINTFDENGGVPSSNSRLVKGKVQRNIFLGSANSEPHLFSNAHKITIYVKTCFYNLEVE
jgi:hypothetical protein